jgi:hypothetical protein
VPNNEVQELHILLKAHKTKAVSYATVIMKDGTKRNIVIRNVN